MIVGYKLANSEALLLKINIFVYSDFDHESKQDYRRV